MTDPVLRALVVDDDDGIRQFAARALRHGGYDVETAGSGTEAVRVVDAQPRFDVAVLDVMMPDMRGDELARRLNHRDPHLKILYLTAYPDQFFALRPTMRSAETVLVKPVTVQELLAAVKRRVQSTA